MLDNCWNLTLEKAVERVLETMFFAAADGSPAEEMPDATDSVGAQLAFRGQESGTLCLRLAPAAALSLAADFLGAEREDVTSEQRTAVVCELANMICGSMMSELDDKNLIQLAPAIPFTGPAPPSTGRVAAECGVELPDGALRVSVERDEGHA